MPEYCDGCGDLTFSGPVNRYDVYSAHCCSTDKPMIGRRRVVATARTQRPIHITCPAWCPKGHSRRKEKT